MTQIIPRNEWEDFVNDLSKRRKGWRARIEVISSEMGDQILDKGLPLVGIALEERKGRTEIEIAVGQDTGHHITHSVKNPEKISFLSEQDDRGGVLELEEANGTKTLIHLDKSMVPAVDAHRSGGLAPKN